MNLMYINCMTHNIIVYFCLLYGYNLPHKNKIGYELIDMSRALRKGG